MYIYLEMKYGNNRYRVGVFGLFFLFIIRFFFWTEFLYICFFVEFFFLSCILDIFGCYLNGCFNNVCFISYSFGISLEFCKDNLYVNK